MICKALFNKILLLERSESPDGILSKTPGKGTGTGKSCGVEEVDLRGNLREKAKNAEKGVRVLRTFEDNVAHQSQKVKERGTFEAAKRTSSPGLSTWSSPGGARWESLL